MAAALTNDVPPGHEPLHRWERRGLFLFLVLVIAFLGLTVRRSTDNEVRRTDATVYFLAGWAVREGVNPYEVPDPRNLHFAYPPIVGIAFQPFADAPPGADRFLILPYDLSLSLWILLSAAITFLAIHWFALGLEESATDPALRSPPTGSRRWWYNRMLPIFVCIAPIGCTYSRGQITPFLVLFIACMFLATIRGKRFLSGIWLSAAICAKIIPGLLIIFPLLRRDGLALAGVAVGSLLWVVALPTAELGATKALEIHEQFINHMIKPALGLGGSTTMQKEMMSMNRPGCQSIKAIAHNYQHWDRENRPETAGSVTKFVHYGSALVLVGGLIIAFGWRRPHDPVNILAMLGGLLTVMCVISPESHTHYFWFPAPLIMALAYRSMESRPSSLLPSASMLTMFIFVGFCYAMVMVPFWSYRREVGIPLYASLFLWIAAIRQLRMTSTVRASVAESRQQDRALAA